MDVFGAVIGAIVAGLLALLFGSWMAMLFIGAAHASDGRIPDLGLTATMWLALIPGVIIGGSAASSSK